MKTNKRPAPLRILTFKDKIKAQHHLNDWATTLEERSEQKNEQFKMQTKTQISQPSNSKDTASPPTTSPKEFHLIDDPNATNSRIRRISFSDAKSHPDDDDEFAFRMIRIENRGEKGMRETAKFN
jgi:hypothetical protein